MMIGDFKPEPSVSCFLLSIPDDVFALISRSLSPNDICNISFCCKSHCELMDSEKIWLAQCEVVKALPLSDIVQWRIGISSYKALCRFLVEVVKPLVGIWVHQKPELGNVVYAMPGFLSVVGCRIIPQKVGPLGIQEGGVMWSPVFEIICGFDGSISFFLHGRDEEGSCLYPGFVTGIEKSCNVLLLEVEPRREKSLHRVEDKFPFRKLRFSDRKKLFDIVAGHVGVHVVKPVSESLFQSGKDDEAMLLERRTMLLKMHKFGGDWKRMSLEEDGLCYNPMKVDIKKMWKKLRYDHNGCMDTDDDDDVDDHILQVTPRKSFGKYIRSGIKHILGSSSSPKKKPSRPRSNLQKFLSSGDGFGLSLKASNIEISSHQGWPIMPEYLLALYKLPIKNPVLGQEYAGLWGGTYGWSPEECIDDKKAFYLLMLTYEEASDKRQVIIGTKILEGTHYMMRHNGSAMFVVNIDTHCLEPFPFDAYGIHHLGDSYSGEGVEDGYGFRDPLSTPGSLFVISDDLLAFVWQETKHVFTLQRLDLEVILKKGLGLFVPPLPPRRNFLYRTRSRTNVFVKPSISSYSSSSE